MSVLVQLGKTLARLLGEDDRRCLLGEDLVGGGMLGLSRAAAADEDLRRRLVSSPLTNAAHVTHAGGLALAGLWPIVLLPSSAALIEALPCLRDLARLPWRSGGMRSLPLLFVAPDGPGFGVGGDAAESAESTLVQVAGLDVWTAGRSGEFSACLRAAADFSNEAPGRPCSVRVLLLPRALMLEEAGESDDQPTLAREPSRCLREGRQATVVAWGAALPAALAAAKACAEADPPVEVTLIELAQLSPIETALPALTAAARATGKIVIAHAGPRSHGIGAELAAVFAERAILQLDAPVRRIAGEQRVVSGHEESSACPSAAAIADAIFDVVHY